MPILIVVLIVVFLLMVIGAVRTKGLPGWRRAVAGLVPALVLVGAAVTYILLVICNIADSPSAACAATTAIALPLMPSYLGITGGTWVASLASVRHESRQRLLMTISATTAVAVPFVVYVVLLNLYQS